MSLFEGGFGSMAHQLRDSDLNMLDVHKRLVAYLNETPQGGRRCGRLRWYLDIASLCLHLLEDVDDSAPRAPNQPFRRISEDPEKLEQLIAEFIAAKDRDLLGMLHAQGLGNEKTRVCSIYARMVMNHAREGDFNKLRAELEPLGINCLGLDN